MNTWCRWTMVVVMAAMVGGGLHRAQGQERPAWQTPPLVRMLAVREGESGRPMVWRDFLDKLAKAQFVFLGETHTDETTHRVELAVLREMTRRRNGKVVLAMEMFERDTQPALDAYLAGQIDESVFIQRARVWGNYVTGYRPLIEFAKRQHLPVVASNFPRPLLGRIARGGEQGWKELRKESPDLVPKQVLPHTAAYWERVDNAIRGHLASMRLPTDPESRRWSTQSLWDNTMAESCVEASEKHPHALVLHVNGGFHSAYHDGTVRQLKLRRPQADCVTVALVPALNPASSEPRGLPVADYIVYVESRARDEHEGKYGVTVGRDRSYRFTLPPDASERHRVPLLIWLGDDGLTADDGVALLQSRFGAQAALAVVSPTYRQRALDGSPGGRWFESDTFSSDVSANVTAIEKIWGYLLRHYPIDADRVVVAGEGAGGTIAVGVGLQTDRISGRFVALLPKRYAKLKDLPVPLRSLWGDKPMPKRSVRVVADASQREWWSAELAMYGEQGVGVQLQTVTAAERDPNSLLSRQLTDLLGFPDGGASEVSGGVLLIDGTTPRAMFWGRLQALWHEASAHESLRVVLGNAEQAGAAGEKIWRPEITPAVFAKPGALPRCPGPFGGTTVLLVDDQASADTKQAWRSLEERDPIAAHSRFHRLRVVTGEAGRTLAEVLGKLREENRRNVLLVPATFAASPAEMWAWQAAAASAQDTMTLHWLPGLGGQRVEGLLQTK